jgi:hypothetical protein
MLRHNNTSIRTLIRLDAHAYLDRERVGRDRVLGPVVIVSPFHAQLLSADADLRNQSPYVLRLNNL